MQKRLLTASFFLVLTTAAHVPGKFFDRNERPPENISEVPKEKALEMMKHVRKAACKKSNGAWAHFSKTTIDSLSALPHVVGFKLVLACHLSNDPDEKKRNRQTLLLQLKKEQRSAGAVAEEYSYFTSNMLCPPPDDKTCEDIAEF